MLVLLFLCAVPVLHLFSGALQSHKGGVRVGTKGFSAPELRCHKSLWFLLLAYSMYTGTYFAQESGLKKKEKEKVAMVLF